MIEGIPKISVRIITYKQEKLVHRAIDSLLAQKDYLYEICISDDGSPDGTWDVLQQYSREHPGLFKLHRNENNLGIFENMEYAWTMPTGDLIYGLAGDDEAGEGWFQKVVEFVQNNNIDYKNERVCIYSDYECRYPSGDSFIFKNDAVLTGIDPMRLSIRGIIGNRGACYSKSILDRFQKVSKGRSYLPESAQDRQVQLFSEKSYYIPKVGNIYYTQIGVNVHFDQKRKEERELVEEYAKEFIESNGYSFPQKDIYYFKYKTEKAKSYRIMGLKHKLLIGWLFLKSIDFRLGIKQIRPKRLLFAFLRRLPHSKPLSWDI